MDKIRITRILVLIILIVSLIPLLWIALYNHSSADDYTYGYLTRDAWNETHNFLAVLWAGLKMVKLEYFAYQGTYTQLVLASLQPAIYGEQFYFIGTFILLGSLIFSTFFFCRFLIGEIFHNRKIADIVAGGILLVSIQLIPFPCEAFYWWNGAVYYIFFHSLLLIQCALFLQMLHRGHCTVTGWILCALLSVLLGGGNYISGLLAAEMCVLFSALSLAKKRCRKELLSTSLLYLVCFAISVMAPVTL